jgi:hypothetical protein
MKGFNYSTNLKTDFSLMKWMMFSGSYAKFQNHPRKLFIVIFKEKA